MNFEPFCGNSKPVECPDVDPPTRCAAPAGHGSSG